MAPADLPPSTDGANFIPIHPGDAGWHPEALATAVAFVAEHATRTFMVIDRGKLIAEHYWECDSGHRQDIASAQKAVVSFLVGMALERGLVALDGPVVEWLGEGWTNETDTERERLVTLRHLLSMSSGLDDQLRCVAPPGTAWAYANDAYHQSKKVLEAVAGASLQELTNDWLWSRIGCTDSAWEPRPDTFDAKGVVMTGYVSTARDMARFGQLMANEGRWGNDVLLADPAYLRASVSTSQPMNPSYGYLWWLGGPEGYMLPYVEKQFEGRLTPASPVDAFGALGLADQKIWVAPSRGLVWVRQGDFAFSRRAAISRFDNAVWELLMAAAPAVDQ